MHVVLSSCPGGTLGKYCSHAYAHATAEGIKSLPRILKGSDMVTYDAFRRLGMKVSIKPVIDLERHSWEINDNDYGNNSLRNTNVVGKLSEPLKTDVGEDHSLVEIFDYGYPHEKLDVLWMNGSSPKTENMQLAFLRVSLSLLF
jgi:hypothetical protein